MTKPKTISQLIVVLQKAQEAYGDLPVGGECEIGVRVTVCDDKGHDVTGVFEGVGSVATLRVI